MDLLCLSEEPPPLAGQTLRCYPLGQEAHLAVTPTQVTCLRQEVFAKGQVRNWSWWMWELDSQLSRSRPGMWNLLAKGPIFIQGIHQLYICTIKHWWPVVVCSRPQLKSPNSGATHTSNFSRRSPPKRLPSEADNNKKRPINIGATTNLSAALTTFQKTSCQIFI